MNRIPVKQHEQEKTLMALTHLDFKIIEGK